MGNAMTPPPHVRIKKGEIRNPGGRPRQPEDVRLARAESKDTCDRIFLKMLHYTSDEIKTVQKDAKSSMLELAVAKILSLAASRGDHFRLQFILDRLYGGNKAFIEVNHLHSMPTPDLIALAKKKILELESSHKTVETVDAVVVEEEQSK